MAELKRTSLIEKYKEGNAIMFFDNVKYSGTDRPWDDLSTELKVSVFMAMHRGIYRGPIHGLLAENVLADEDLKFLTRNLRNFSQEDLQDLWSYRIRLDDGGQRHSGFKNNMGLVEKEDLMKVDLFTDALLGIFAGGATIGGGANTPRVSTEEAKEKTGEYLIENEDKILRLVAFEEFKFKEFDLLLTRKINEFLKTNPTIYGLEIALYNAEFVNENFYEWPSDKKLQITKEKAIKGKVDTSLYTKLQTPYQKPFQSIDEKNDVLLDETNGFSNFKAGKITKDTYWGFGEMLTLASVEGAYAEFIAEFLDELKDVGESQYRYDQRVIKMMFESAADTYLAKSFEMDVYTGGTIWAGTKYKKVKQTFTPLFFAAKMILDVLRKEAWKEYAKILKDLSLEDLDDPEKYNPEEAAKKAFEVGEIAAANSEAAMGGSPEERPEPLSDKEIEERQRFMKQCALMTRLPDLAEQHIKILEKREADEVSQVHKNGYYNQRFYMVMDGNSGDQAGLITKILLPQSDNISEFLDIKPAVHAFLVPKLRFFKVFSGGGGVTSQEEFKFRNFTSTERVNNLFSSTFDRGGDYGIKEFSFSFEGSTPATAKNDIKAKLSLYFQSFEDFIEKRDGNNSPFVDMLLLPGKIKKDDGSGSESLLQYSAQYYRIRVDVGWNIKSIQDVKNLSGVDYGSLKRALTKTNKSFYLNMIDHTINFRDDGSVQIDVDYRAYAETSLKSTNLDALADEEAQKTLQKARDDYRKVLQTGKCSIAEENKIRRQLLQLQDLLKKKGFQSIMNRLIKNDFVYFKKVRSATDNNFQKTGFFTKAVQFAGEPEEPSKSKTKKEAAENGGDATLDFSDDFFEEKLSTESDFKYINYFYLGDLMYVILDSLYESQAPQKYIDGFEKFKFLLGSFEFQDSFKNDSPIKTINMASIPISAEIFFEWFSENIIKSERNSYPIMYFIRDLCTFLIGEILTENCFKQSLDRKLQFHTTNFLGIENPFASQAGPLINVSAMYEAGDLPLVQDSEEQVPISKMTNYIAIYIDTPKHSIDPNPQSGLRRGNKSIDGKNGIYHFQIGRDRGLLKKLKFAKSDMKYVREARFFRHGFDGLMQLANVYNVSLDMVGNTLFYPGMELFINPLGFLGAKNNNYNPTVVGTIANRLGFGGYHIITRVNSKIAPGTFTTQVDAMFTYSGDGLAASKLVGSAKEANKDKVKAIDQKDTRSQDDKNYCAAIYNQVIQNALDIIEDEQKYQPIDFDMSKRETQLVPNPAVVPAQTQTSPSQVIEQIEAGEITVEDAIETMENEDNQLLIPDYVLEQINQIMSESGVPLDARQDEVTSLLRGEGLSEDQIAEFIFNYN